MLQGRKIIFPFKGKQVKRAIKAIQTDMSEQNYAFNLKKKKLNFFGEI